MRAARCPTMPSPVTITLAGGRAVVVVNVLIVTHINRAKGATSGDNPTGKGTTYSRGTRWCD